MKVYLCGPMRSYPEFNFPAFMDAAGRLEKAGHQVFNPAERDLRGGFDPSGTKGTDDELAGLNFDLRAALAADLAWICAEADAVVALTGWEKSRGACAEVAVARALGLPVYGVEELLKGEAGD